MISNHLIGIRSFIDSHGRVHYSYNFRLVTGRLSCMIAGTKILTTIGEINIEDICYGLIPGTHSKLKSPVQVITKEGEVTVDTGVIYEEVDTITLEFEDGRVITGARDHRLMTKDGWKTMEQIEINEEVEILEF